MDKAVASQNQTASELISKRTADLVDGSAFNALVYQVPVLNRAGKSKPSKKAKPSAIGP